jgi:hypothetical protein
MLKTFVRCIDSRLSWKVIMNKALINIVQELCKHFAQAAQGIPSAKPLAQTANSIPTPQAPN